MIGKIIATVMTIVVVGFFITMLVMIQYGPGREYNRDLTIKLKRPLNNLYDLQTYIEKTKRDRTALDEKVLNDLAGEFEYFYFPKNINDSRLPFIACRKESRGAYKNFKGEIEKFEIGLGYFVLHGSKFKIKTLLPSQLDNFLLLNEKGTELSESYLLSGEAIVIGGKSKLEIRVD